MTNDTEKQPRYNGIPKQVSRKDFNRYILPHLKKRVKGPEPKLSFYKPIQLHPLCFTYRHSMESTPTPAEGNPLV